MGAAAAAEAEALRAENEALKAQVSGLKAQLAAATTALDQQQLAGAMGAAGGAAAPAK